ncbi:L-serine ammonia-lyase, iron-sulfur-dependent, subunit beta, partial [Paraburkholderia sp. SIMBA_054]
HSFRSGNELLALCESTGKSIAQLMWDNERVWHTEEETRAGLLKIWDVMQSCVSRGCGINNPDADGNLPGPFQVKRRAPQLYRALSGNP